MGWRAHRKDKGGNIATDRDHADITTSLTPEQVRRAEIVRELLASWLADESGYDERVWLEVQQGLEEARTQSRPLFHA